jgi:acyl-CoA thioester hydrolase
VAAAVAALAAGRDAAACDLTARARTVACVPEPFVHHERVRFGDLDAMRHLNNVVFLRYFESARIAYLRELAPGHDPSSPESGTFGFIFAECHINYRSPVQFDELLAIGCSVGEVRRSAFRIDFRMTVEERLAAEGYGWLVGFDYDAQESRPLPDTLRGSLEAAL